MRAPASESKVLQILSMLDPSGEELLRKNCREVAVCSPERQEVLASIADADAVVLRSPAGIDSEMIAAAPRLRVISVSGVGYDSIDVDAATAAGVVVLHSPGVGASAVAEYAVGALIMCGRNIWASDAAIRQGSVTWFDRSDQFPTVELRDRRLGLVGLGNIGLEVARIAHDALGMEVVGHDYKPEAVPTYIERAGLKEVMESADFVSVHVPYTAQTSGMIGRDQIFSMRPGAALVNTSRGGIVDEQAVADALRSGHLRFAVFDVFASEPRSDETPLVGAPNCFLTPHIAGMTDRARRRLALAVAEGVIDVLDGRPDVTRVVNRSVLG
jgi:phosphoglycerate dehydrogenase-like enzyme